MSELWLNECWKKEKKFFKKNIWWDVFMIIRVFKSSFLGIDSINFFGVGNFEVCFWVIRYSG